MTVFVLRVLACNILMAGLTDVYTLRNYGKPVNCSLTMLYPAQVKILALGVGLEHGQKRTLTEHETGTIHKVNVSFWIICTSNLTLLLLPQCDKRGLPDFVQVGGGDGLSQLSMVDSICGTNSEPGQLTSDVLRLGPGSTKKANPGVSLNGVGGGILFTA